MSKEEKLLPCRICGKLPIYQSYEYVCANDGEHWYENQEIRSRNEWNEKNAKSD